MDHDSKSQSQNMNTYVHIIMVNIQIYVTTMFGMQETYNVCVNVGVLFIFNTLSAMGDNFPKVHWGCSPCPSSTSPWCR